MKKILVLILLLAFITNCSTVKKIAGLTGGIYGKIQFPLQQNEFEKFKEELLANTIIKINNNHATIDEKGYFWFMDLPIGKHDIEYFHPDYKMQILKDVQVKHNQLSLAFCRFAPKSTTLESDLIKNWQEQGMGTVTMVDPFDRGAIKITSRRRIKIDIYVGVLIPWYDSKSHYPHHKGTFWGGVLIGNATDTSLVLQDILPGIYDISLNFSGISSRYYQNVIIKKDTISVIKISEVPPPTLENWREWSPIYQKLE